MAYVPSLHYNNGIGCLSTNDEESVSIGPGGLVIQAGLVTGPIITGTINTAGFTTTNSNGFNFNSDINMNTNDLINVGTITAANIVANGQVTFNDTAGGTFTSDVPTTFNETVTFNEDITVSSELFINGDTTFNATVTFNEDITVGSELYINGDTTFNAIVTFNGAITINDAVTINSTLQFSDGSQQSTAFTGFVVPVITNFSGAITLPPWTFINATSHEWQLSTILDIGLYTVTWQGQLNNLQLATFAGLATGLLSGSSSAVSQIKYPNIQLLKVTNTGTNDNFIYFGGSITYYNPIVQAVAIYVDVSNGYIAGTVPSVANLYSASIIKLS